MDNVNTNCTIEIILEDLGYDTSLIDRMSEADRKEFTEKIAPHVQQWLAPYDPTWVQSLPSIIAALCHRFNVPFTGEIEPKFVRKPKNKAVRTW
jgi:hypothetical protein